MIAKLEIRNFQKWHRLSIEFDKRVTTIVGPTDIGKSAILRALRWVCLNKPSADEIRNDTAEFVYVRLTVDEHVIERRSGKRNVYKLDGMDFVSFKTGVPDEIANLLQVCEYNFQEQNDPIFGLSLSPGELSKQLNKIVNLDLIDRVLAETGSALRTAKTVVSVTEQRLSEQRKKKQELAFVPAMVSEYSRITKETEQLELKCRKHSELYVLTEQVKQSKEAIRTTGDIATASEEIVSEFDKRQILVQRQKTLQNTINGIEEKILQVEKLTQIAWTPEHEALLNSARNRNTEQQTLAGMLEDIKRATRERDEYQEQAEKFHRLLDKEFGDVCPICKQNTNPIPY